MASHKRFHNEGIRIDTPLLPAQEPMAGGCKTHHKQFPQLLDFLLYFQQLMVATTAKNRLRPCLESYLK